MAKHTAFEILYREYYRRVFGLCRQLLNANNLAEDATQEVFVRAYKNFSKYKVEQPFWQWIAAIANNYCIDQIRQHRRGEAVFDESPEDLEHIESADAPVITRLMTGQDHQLLNEAVAALPDKFRVPLVLAYFHQASYDEIAHYLDVQRNHVGVLLLRAKQKLREHLQQHRDRGTL